MSKFFTYVLFEKGFLFGFLMLTLFGLTQCKTGGSASGGSLKPIRTLIVGGGSSHDFDKWYKQADSTTLVKDGFASVTYTSDIASIPNHLSQADVLYLTTNQVISDPKVRQSIMNFVASGKGVVLTHAGTWYNNREWPEFNKQLVGGGSRSHESYGAFDVSITNTDHPITKNITEKTFNIKDELYRMNRDSTGAAIEILAIATVPNSTTTYPLLWVTKSENARIACFTLGHDGEAHDKPVYQQLLKNAIRWVARKS